MRLALTSFAAAAAIIVGAWAWLGAPIAMPQAPIQPGEKLYCLSYAPFRGWQTPLDLSTHISAAQIDEDLTQLATITDCVRTYSVDFGLDQIAGIAARHGLKVIQGLWLSDHADRNRYQIETAVALANRYPDTIRSIVVGNEVLLRGNMSANELADTISSVKARVKVPVTYADVWEFWLRNRALAAAVDFVTIHILPYWEDFPVAAPMAAPHVESIYRQVKAAFPDKDILIGEVGWPSAGRMREAALPSLANEARVIQDVLALAKREMFHVNFIEAYDSPWKRALEGTVGGHWGVFDDARHRKFAWGEAVSNHPLWQWQAAGGVAFAFAIFVFAGAVDGRQYKSPSRWLLVGLNAVAGGILIGWAVENVPLESLGIAGWLRSIAYLVVAFVSPLLASAAVVRLKPMPRFSRVLGPANHRTADVLTFAVGILGIAIFLLALQAALGLVFDPRYKDFPFAPLTAAIVPLLTLSFAGPQQFGARGAAEIAAGVTLALSALYIVLNEGLANWQSLWLCAAFFALALTLIRVRDVPG